MSFQYNRFADLVYYVLAHMPIDNDADVSDHAFAEEMAGQLGVTPGVPRELIDYYDAHFDRIAMIDFIPFAVEGVRECREALASSGMLTGEDMKAFADPFFDVCEGVSDKFYEWWNRRHAEALMSAGEVYSRFESLKERFAGFFSALGIGTSVVFSYTLRQNGRGFCMSDVYSVYLPFPEADEEILPCFLQFLHECTHVLTDPLIESEILMADGSHETAEHQALCFDEYLIAELCPDLMEAYKKKFGDENLRFAKRALGEDGTARIKARLKEILREDDI